MMDIKPVYTLMINEGEEHISAPTEVVIEMENGNKYEGLFISCDEYGVNVELGEEKSNIYKFLYANIKEIEEV